MLQIALLIDAENLTSNSIELYLRYLSKLGEVKIRRAYANWEKNNPKSWYPLIESGLIEKRKLLKISNKNAADFTLIREGSELIRSKEIDAIAVYSGDTGYLMAIESWQGLGIKVIAFKRKGVHVELVRAANYTIDCNSGGIEHKEDLLSNSAGTTIKRVRNIILPGLKVIGSIDLPSFKPTPEISKDNTISHWKEVIVNILKNCGGRMLVSRLGEVLKMQFPNFTPSAYQCKKFTLFLKKHIPEINTNLSPDGMTYWAEIKQTTPYKF